MAVDRNPIFRPVSLAVILGLLVICIGLGAMMFITIEAASVVQDKDVQKLLARLSWMALVLLCLAMLMTFWVVLRHVRTQMRSRSAPPGEPTPYVNAWELAGKRFQLNEDIEPEDPDYLADDGEDEDDEDDDDEDDEPGSRPPRDRWR